MAERQITATKTPDLIYQPEIYLRKNDFEATIWNKGYEVYLDKMMPCPCKAKSLPGALLSCRNCGGSGYVLIKRYQTKMVLQSMNLDTKFKDWSEEKMGTVRITSLAVDEVSYYDRIILHTENSLYRQLVYGKKHEDSGEIYISLAFEPKEIKYLIFFEGEGNPLTFLYPSDYSIISNKIILDSKFKEIFKQNLDNNLNFSIEYSCSPQFHVIDIGRDFMSSEDKDKNTGEVSLNQFPRYSVGRRSHFVFDFNNFNNDYLYDNIKR